MAFGSFLGGLNPLKKRRSGVVSAMTGESPAFAPAPGGLPEGYGFNDLAGYEEMRRRNLGLEAEKTLLDRRGQLATSLAEQGKQRFALQNPAILEDLNSRGLLNSSSAVNSAQADALKEIELENQSRLMNWDEAAVGARLQGEQDALDSALDLRRGNLEQRYADANANREEGLARDLARESRRGGITQSLIGAGGLIGGGMLSGFFNRKPTNPTTNPTNTTTSPGGFAGGGMFSNLGRNKLSAYGNPGEGQLASAGVPDVAGTPAPPGAFQPGGFMSSALPLGLLTAGGIAGYQSLSDKGKSIVAPLVNPVKTVSTVGKAVSNIGKKLCFDGMTPVTMFDGSVKPICELDLDDKTRGGIVESVRVSKTSDGTLFDYEGEKVTGSHAVFEDGKWIRVEDSQIAKPIEGEAIVYSIITSTHRIFVNDIVFADEMENDDWEDLTIDESLEALNQKEMVGTNGA